MLDREARSTSSRAQRTLAAGFAAAAIIGAAVAAQQNSVLPQPRADRLPAPQQGTANRNLRVARPEGVMPAVPPGFTVTSYADLQSPRMMVYAPNGDLFISSPATNSITVLRDANNDGVFEARSVFAGDAARATQPAPAPQSGSADTADRAWRRRTAAAASDIRTA